MNNYNDYKDYGYDNLEKARRLNIFGGVRWGNRTFTDIDGIMDWTDKYWIILETKESYETMKKGQRIALERLVDDLASVVKHDRTGQEYKKSAVAFILEHPPTLDDIDVGNCYVALIRYNGRWRAVNPPIRTKAAIDNFLDHDGKLTI